MTDNERIERLKVLKDRCGTCRHLYTEIFSSLADHECRADGGRGWFQLSEVERDWHNLCVVASVKDQSVGIVRRNGNWWSHATPSFCTKASETPCPTYQRADP